MIEDWKNGDYDLAVAGGLQMLSSLSMIFMKCFTGDTLVATEDGDKRIDEIAVGDAVWAEDTITGERNQYGMPDSKTDIDMEEVISGNCGTSTFANGEKLTYTYDDLNCPILQKSVDKNGTVIAQYAYTLGKSGDTVINGIPFGIHVLKQEFHMVSHFVLFFTVPAVSTKPFFRNTYSF